MKRIAWLFILFIAIAGFTFVPAAHAIAPSTDAQTFGDAVDKCAKDDTVCKEWYNTDSFNANAFIVVGESTGLPTTDPNGYLGYKRSAVAQAGNLMVAMYTNPPADLALWIRDTGQSLGFIPKQAYAQGIGFTGLSPILPIWKAFRNISYALLAVVMVIIGFMVMFRQKIDPKTVVTVQNALPKIVLALILITFSYAIAAFFIDLMYLVMSIIINLIVSSSGSALGADTATKYISGNLATVFNALFAGGWSSINDIIKLAFYNNQGGFWFIPQAINTVTAVPVASVLITLIVSIAILFGFVRILFMLISAYIQIIVAVLIAPFQLMTEALPGSTSFSSWLKNMVSNLSVFPITAAMMLVGTILTQSNAGRMWTPPLLSSAGANGITGLIGLGILLTIPSVANSVKEALKSKAPVEAGLGAILGPVGGGVGQLMTFGYQASMINSMIRGPHKDPSDLQNALKGAQNPTGPITGEKS